jgi:hypothetical protein
VHAAVLDDAQVGVFNAPPCSIEARVLLWLTLLLLWWLRLLWRLWCLRLLWWLMLLMLMLWRADEAPLQVKAHAAGLGAAGDTPAERDADREAVCVDGGAKALAIDHVAKLMIGPLL